ncbi:2-oxo-4-hydroxy-4-carboxy-5-ureidoimidazoline decarboxylase [Paenibacillus rhizovicinus]|uniref:2-oxo-4-hydroxy-4-carboxy-5-ureidoimidazoline decarboxylase n=1 Tax=Paenibacillus rhizovicinus TaxID=2704463 RepID=A0A6C0PA47_9BACL|nr:2-oxo-4-hydroxy-4-carboxy-5-ureidoimidazoline decarboxylase [Paenibacillus rhizovicinus]
MQLWQLNTLSREMFVAQLGSVFERSPWVAESVWQLRPFHSVNELHEAMMQAVMEAPEEKAIALLRAHPDLASRAAMTTDSIEEQRPAGLDALTPEEYDRFASLNAAYAEKHGFPFIIAVRGKTIEDILAAMAMRLQHDGQRELRQALLEAGRIAELRLHGRIEE